MKNVKVLGTGCANCKRTLATIEEVVKAKGMEIELEKIEDIAAIMGYGVMSTPGVVIDGQVVHAGGVPDRKTVEGWLTGVTSTPTPSSGGCCSGGKCC